MITGQRYSVVILTFNEAKNLEGCLQSLIGHDDIHILDSGSSDGTRDLARQLGANVFCNPFLGFGNQRNWAIDNISTKYDWQFHLDADERMTPQLMAELAMIVSTETPHGGYRVPSKLMFFGHWLRRSGQYPGYQVRFFHKRRLRFVDHGHGQRELSEFSIGTLREPLLHYGFSKGIDEWFRKHVSYARREAEQARLPDSAGGGSIWSLDETVRRRRLKQLFAKLPGRYFLRLLQLLILRGGILDGWRGLTFARMLATYESMIEVYQSLLARGMDPDNPE